MILRIFIVWVHLIFREAVHLLLNHPAVEIVGLSVDRQIALAEVKALQPNTNIIEETEGTALAHSEAAQFPETRTGKLRGIRLSLQDIELWLYQQRWLIVISLGLLMTFQMIRVFYTLLVYDFGERYGQTLAAVPALLVFLSPFLTPLIIRMLKPRTSLFMTFGGLAIVRFLIQVSRDVNLNLVLSGIAIVLALMGLVLALSRFNTASTRDRHQLALGIFVGMILETALHGAFLTWDFVWQPGPIPLVVALMVSIIALLALWQVQSDFQNYQFQTPGLRSMVPIIAMGPFFMLEMLFLQNVAFVASSSLTSMETGLSVVLVGDAVGLWMTSQVAGKGLTIRVTVGVVLVIVTTLLPVANGIAVMMLVIIGQAAVGGLLTCILSGLVGENDHRGAWRMSVVVGAGSLLFALLTILYYISVLITLPFSYTILPSIAAIVILLAAIGTPARNSGPVPNRSLILLPLGLLLVPLLLLVTRPIYPAASVTGNSFRLMDYNTHQTINVDGWLDPEGIAQVIETQQPDIVALQEISRGWMIAGSLDVAEWLSRRLQMPYVYTPGHDYQFGNMILTRMPITDWSFTRLPLQNVPLGRGLIRAEITLPDGGSITLINTHLSAYASTADRIPQVQKVIETWGNAARTLIVGDMNAHPTDDDIALFLNSGFASAQDVTDNSELLTFNSAEPSERIDWIFGTSDMTFSNFAIPTTTASDHLPLSVVVTAE